jgi:hypothetical protein
MLLLKLPFVFNIPFSECRGYFSTIYYWKIQSSPNFKSKCWPPQVVSQHHNSSGELWYPHTIITLGHHLVRRSLKTSEHFVDSAGMFSFIVSTCRSQHCKPYITVSLNAGVGAFHGNLPHVAYVDNQCKSSLLCDSISIATVPLCPCHGKHVTYRQ